LNIKNRINRVKRTINWIPGNDFKQSQKKHFTLDTIALKSLLVRCLAFQQFSYPSFKKSTNVPYAIRKQIILDCSQLGNNSHRTVWNESHDIADEFNCFIWYYSTAVSVVWFDAYENHGSSFFTDSFIVRGLRTDVPKTPRTGYCHPRSQIVCQIEQYVRAIALYVAMTEKS